jgi:hypothetical protein
VPRKNDDGTASTGGALHPRGLTELNRAGAERCRPTPYLLVETGMLCTHPQAPFILEVLPRTTMSRLRSAVDALAAGRLTVMPFPPKKNRFWTTVRSDSQKDYKVIVIGTRVVCTCPDNHYRDVCCKHIVAVAFAALGQPVDLPQAQGKPKREELRPKQRKGKIQRANTISRDREGKGKKRSH